MGASSSKKELISDHFKGEELGIKIVGAEVCRPHKALRWGEGNVEHEYVLFTLEKANSEGFRFLRVDYGSKLRHKFVYSFHVTKLEAHQKEVYVHNPKLLADEAEVYAHVSYDTSKCGGDCSNHTVVALQKYYENIDVPNIEILLKKHSWDIARKAMRTILKDGNDEKLPCIPQEEYDVAIKTLNEHHFYQNFAVLANDRYREEAFPENVAEAVGHAAIHAALHALH